MDVSALIDNRAVEENQTISAPKSQIDFGICFDVDGVLARGTLALPPALRMIRRLQNEQGDVTVPIVFVTNALNRNIDKANQISSWLNVSISPDQMIQAHGPLKVFHQFHDKFCLVVGQGKIQEIAQECGFTRFCTVEDIADAYPLLDMVDHDNRKHVAQYGYEEKEFPRVEAVILLGEPKRWESALQILVDLLKTDGLPNSAPQSVPEEHLPVIACNMDLQFMDRASMPRFGHGAFLCCLEALYKKSTGFELKYTSLVGKPSEITMRYAEHCITRQARKMGIKNIIKRLYLIGDTPEVDIVGTGLYQRSIQRQASRDISTDASPKDLDVEDPELPVSRNMPPGSALTKQTALECLGVLVCTGVYNPSEGSTYHDGEKHYKGHRDFPFNHQLYAPKKECDDVDEAVAYIMQREQTICLDKQSEQ